MRALPVQNTPVRFRANDRLLAAALAKAEREGMSLSELMRAALRREVSAC
jgi:predicted HicB family RNase H-like nuclease